MIIAQTRAKNTPWVCAGLAFFEARAWRFPFVEMTNHRNTREARRVIKYFPFVDITIVGFTARVVIGAILSKAVHALTMAEQASY